MFDSVRAYFWEDLDFHLLLNADLFFLENTVIFPPLSSRLVSFRVQHGKEEKERKRGGRNEGKREMEGKGRGRKGEMRTTVRKGREEEDVTPSP